MYSLLYQGNVAKRIALLCGINQDLKLAFLSVRFYIFKSVHRFSKSKKTNK